MRIVRLLVVNLGAAAIGLFAAKILLADRDFSIDLMSFLTVIVIFAILQAILTPLILQMTVKAAPPLAGGIGLLSTFVALWITSLIVGDNMSLGGLVTHLLASLIVWLVAAIATMALRKFLFKQAIAGAN